MTPAHTAVPAHGLRRRLLLWTPPLAWMAILFVASSSSSPGGGVSVPDWLTHGAAYLVLAVLLGRALAGGQRAAATGRVVGLAAVLATAYGVSDEYHQSFVPGRDASVGDVLKDGAGAALGAVWYRRRARAGGDEAAA